MKKILVTGADGFIGSHLVEVLKEYDCNIIALSQYNSFNNNGWLEDIKIDQNIKVVNGDIRDSYFCEKITEGVDIIIHLAALISIPYSYTSPYAYVDTNINGTLNICMAALKNKVKRVLHTSTSEVYGTANYVPIDEKHPKQAQSPYSASKIGADALATSLYNSKDLPLSIIRPFNTYGPRQSARAIIPSIISQIASGEKKIKIGNLEPTRDFNFVIDVCKYIVEIAFNYETIGQTINIGSNEEISIGNLFDLIKQLMNTDCKIDEEDMRYRPQKSEVFRLRCDNSLLHSLVKYRNKYDIKSGLEETIKWFSDSSNLAKYKTNEYNI